MSTTVSSGQTFSGAITGTTVSVTSGGVASGVSAGWNSPVDGFLFVSSGGSAVATTLNYGGYLVLDGGSAPGVLPPAAVGCCNGRPAG